MTKSADAQLTDFILAEWQREVPEEVSVAARAIAERYGDSVSGIVFYGSCLRTGEIEDKILDFYVIVDNYHAAYDKRWLAVGNKVLPPNVFYHEIKVGSLTVRSKYAVLSMEDLAFRVSRDCLNVSVWARFCQPCLFIHARTQADKQFAATHVATAVTTMLNNLQELKPEAITSRQAWVAAFEETYASELRSERSGKGLEIYLLDQDRYDRIAPIAFDVIGAVQGTGWRAKYKWLLRRWNGKLVSFLRLVKASMTFDGGIDYLAWKIRRHSGVEIPIEDWMRRHPVVAGVVLFWRLRHKGAFK